MKLPRRPELGDLERSVLEALWASPTPLSVRDVRERVERRPALAYTTVLTVLDRLHEKSFVTRHKDGRAFLYRPRIGRAQWLGERAARVLAAEDGGTTAVLAAFLDSAERADPNIVSDLADLIAKRRQHQKKGS